MDKPKTLKKNFPEPDDLIDIWDIKTGKKITIKEAMRRKIKNEK